MYYYDDNSLLSKLERKIGRFAIKNLAYILVFAMATVYVLDYLLIRFDKLPISAYMSFDRARILQGEVWRVITFIFLPHGSNVFLTLLTLYFYWFIGTTVENEWGAFRFNAFYLIGYLGSVASGFIMGGTTNYYLNLSMFLAFAILNAESVVRLFFFIPIKVKWLALIDLAIILLDLIIAPPFMKIAIVFSLFNVALFFFKDLYRSIKNFFRRRRYKKQVETYYYEKDVNPPKAKKTKVKKSKKAKKSDFHVVSDNDEFFN